MFKKSTSVIHFPVALLLILLSAGDLGAQEAAFRCGTVGPEAELLTKRLLANIAYAEQNPVDMRSTVYVPIKFHLVARNDGTGRVEDSKVLDELCYLNSVFAELDIQFYMRGGFDIVNNTAVYETPQSTQGSIMALRRDSKAMNVWIIGEADNNSGDNSQVLAYYSVSGDLIAINRDQIGAPSKALAHEIGHFFSLLHTHNGWDSKPWEKSVGTAPLISPDGVATERVARTNCVRAGDYICDTPADYNGFGWGPCNYTGGALDPDSTLLDPDETNFMSYFFGCGPGTQKFSDDQKRLIRTDLTTTAGCTECLNTPSRAYLTQEAFTPEEISQAPALISPVNGASAAGGSGAIRLEWTATAGATAYIVEVDRVPTFSVRPTKLSVQTNAADITGLEVGKRYYWRVRPYNSYRTCSSLISTTTSFLVTDAVSGVTNLEFLRSFSVSPNPVSGSQELYLLLDTEESFEADVNLFNITGQAVAPLGSVRFTTGSNRLQIPVTNLAPGVYLLSLTTEKGRANQRVVVEN